MIVSRTWKENQNIPEKSESPSDYELLAEQGSYLSHQLSRVPFFLYKYWLIFNIPITLYLLSMAIWTFLHDPLQWMNSAAPLAIGYMLFLYGCGQMLYAMNIKKSRIAQESETKFQYYLIISVGGVISLLKIILGTEGNVVTRMFWLVIFYQIFSPVVHLVGGFAVLQAFKMNHPIVRMSEYQRVSKGENKDFLQQNEAIASEFSKYDEQLNRCPYFIFNWLLKLAVVSELRSIFASLEEFDWLWQFSKKLVKFELYMCLLLIGFGVLSSLLNAYSSFQMEVAMTARSLEKCKRAIIWLKICTVLSIIKCLFVRKWMDLNDFLGVLDGAYLWRFLFSVIIPILSLIGGLQVRKIVKERENFIKVSSYSQDLYL